MTTRSALAAKSRRAAGGRSWNLIRVGLLVIGVWAVAWPTAASACEGEDLQRASLIVQKFQEDGQRLGYQCAISANPVDCVLRGSQTIIEHYTPIIEALPPSCQEFVRRAVGSTAGSADGGGTQCMGGVCCDSTGCY